MMIGRLGLYLDQIRYAHVNTRGFARKHWKFFEEFLHNIKPYLRDVKGKRVLDVGCGKSYWLTLLLHNYGAKVTGIDSEFVQAGISPWKYRQIAGKNGLERALKTLYWDLLHSRAYYDELSKLCGLPLAAEGLDIRQMDATNLAFPDDHFDLVVSHEVFEHLPDVPGALSELRRTMRPGGLTYIYIHPFTSLSGGHSIKWKFPDTNPPDDVPPWDHLRDNLFPQIPSYINRLRAHEYREMFEEAFDILEWIPTETEGERFLTPGIKQELSNYSEGELLTKGIIVIARKA